MLAARQRDALQSRRKPLLQQDLSDRPICSVVAALGFGVPRFLEEIGNDHAVAEEQDLDEDVVKLGSLSIH